jgi:hypothetical protein
MYQIEHQIKLKKNVHFIQNGQWILVKWDI